MEKTLKHNDSLPLGSLEKGVEVELTRIIGKTCGVKFASSSNNVVVDINVTEEKKQIIPESDIWRVSIHSNFEFKFEVKVNGKIHGILNS